LKVNFNTLKELTKYAKLHGITRKKGLHTSTNGIIFHIREKDYRFISTLTIKSLLHLFSLRFKDFKMKISDSLEFMDSATT